MVYVKGICIMNSFYVNKVYIELLYYINQNKGQENSYKNHKNLIIDALGYRERSDEFKKIMDSLIGAGYITQSPTIPSQLFITEEGTIFLDNYYRFQMLGFFAKFTTIFKNNFSSIVTVIALMLSVVALIVHHAA